MYTPVLVILLSVSQHMVAPGPPALARVEVYAPDGPGFGTGFLVDKNDERAYVLTAGHMLVPGKIIVQFSDGSKYIGRGLMRDRTCDLGLIEIAPPANIDPVRIAKTNKLGETVYGMGFGMSGKYRYYEGTTAELSEGTNVLISEFFPPDLGGAGMITTYVSEVGDSGGPQVNADNEVCGVISGTDDVMTTIGPNAAHIRSFLKRRGPLSRIIKLRTARFDERYVGPLPPLPPLMIE